MDIRTDKYTIAKCYFFSLVWSLASIAYWYAIYIHFKNHKDHLRVVCTNKMKNGSLDSRRNQLKIITLAVTLKILKLIYFPIKKYSGKIMCMFLIQWQAPKQNWIRWKLVLKSDSSRPSRYHQFFMYSSETKINQHHS